MAKRRTTKKKVAKPKKAKNLTAFQKATKKFKGKKLDNLRPKKSKPRIDPLWTLEDGVTYSNLSKFQTCRQRFHIGKIQGWKPKGINFPLEFGNIFHHMIEAQDRGIPTDQMYKIANNYVNAKIKDQSPGPEQLKDLSMLAAITVVTFEHYVAFWEQHASISMDVKGVEKHFYEKDFHWLGKEIAFDVNYRLPNGRVIRLRGKKDGKFLIKKNIPGTWILETKTKGRVDETAITNGLHKDMQTGMYLTAEQILQSGRPPKGVLYNLIRRTQLKPRVKESVKDFTKRLDEDMLKRPNWYFMRWSREITEQELDDFQRHLLNPSLFQIAQWWDSIKNNPMNPFETTCDCMSDPEPREFPCTACNGSGGPIDNMLHYERAFGNYDASANSARGEYFEIITDDNYSFYEQQKYAFPELEEEDDLDQYLVGVEAN